MNKISRLLCSLGLMVSPCLQPSARAQGKEIVFRGEGTVRDAQALEDGVLFKIAYTHIQRDGKAVSTQIRQSDLNGKLLVDENTQYNEQGRFKLYTMTQNQTGDSARVEVKGSEVEISYTQDGKTKVSREPYSDDTNAPGSLMSYMSAYTRRLEQGQGFPVRLAVPDRGTVMGFDILAENEKCRQSGGDLCAHLALSNFLLKKLVKPVFMAFQKSAHGYQPLALETPAIVRRQKGQSFEKFTARIDYQRAR